MPFLELDIEVRAGEEEEKSNLVFEIRFVTTDSSWKNEKSYADFEAMHENLKAEPLLKDTKLPHFPENSYTRAVKRGDERSIKKSRTGLEQQLQTYLSKLVYTCMKDPEIELQQNFLVSLPKLNKFINGPKEWTETIQYLRFPRTVGIMDTKKEKEGMLAQIYIRKTEGDLTYIREKKFFQIVSDGSCRVYTDNSLDECVSLMNLRSAQYERHPVGKKYRNAIAITQGKRNWFLAFKRDLELQSWISYFSKQAIVTTEGISERESSMSKAQIQSMDSTAAISKLSELIKDKAYNEYLLRDIKEKIKQDKESQKQQIKRLEKEIEESRKFWADSFQKKQLEKTRAEGARLRAKQELHKLFPDSEERDEFCRQISESKSTSLTKEEKIDQRSRVHLHTHAQKHKHVHKHKHLKSFLNHDVFHRKTFTNSSIYDREKAIAANCRLQDCPSGICEHKGIELDKKEKPDEGSPSVLIRKFPENTNESHPSTILEVS